MVVRRQLPSCLRMRDATITQLGFVVRGSYLIGVAALAAMQARTYGAEEPLHARERLRQGFPAHQRQACCMDQQGTSALKSPDMTSQQPQSKGWTCARGWTAPGPGGSI